MNPAAQGEGISRRKMLKRIGAGAAVAWTVPILTSLRTPAFAASSITCPAIGCPGDCKICLGCVSPGCMSGSCAGGLGCFFNQDTAGTCHNFQNIFCCCTTPCTQNRSCGPSSFCLCSPNGCGQSVCAPCCGTNCHKPGCGSGRKVA